MIFDDVREIKDDSEAGSLSVSGSEFYSPTDSPKISVNNSQIKSEDHNSKGFCIQQQTSNTTKSKR